MSIPMNESDPLGAPPVKMANPCIKECGVCAECARYMSTRCPPRNVAQPTEISIKSRAEFYQVALREEGEAKEVLRKAQADLAKAEEALNDASAQLTLTRDGLFKACGL